MEDGIWLTDFEHFGDEARLKLAAIHRVLQAHFGQIVDMGRVNDGYWYGVPAPDSERTYRVVAIDGDVILALNTTDADAAAMLQQAGVLDWLTAPSGAYNRAVISETPAGPVARYAGES